MPKLLVFLACLAWLIHQIKQTIVSNPRNWWISLDSTSQIGLLDKIERISLTRSVQVTRINYLQLVLKWSFDIEIYYLQRKWNITSHSIQCILTRRKIYRVLFFFHLNHFAFIKNSLLFSQIMAKITSIRLSYITKELIH